MVLLETGTPGTSREIYSEDANGETRTRNPWITMFLKSIDLYAKHWSKREQVELKYLSEWKDQLKELVADRISRLKGHFKSPKCKVLVNLMLKTPSIKYMPIIFWSLQTKLPIM